jgi:hypothetical protein
MGQKMGGCVTGSVVLADTGAVVSARWKQLLSFALELLSGRWCLAKDQTLDHSRDKRWLSRRHYRWLSR